MERVKERLQIARTALSAFKETVGRNDLNTLERDGAIQRFEFTYETVWKAIQAYLDSVEKIKITSPRGIVRAYFQAGLLSDDDSQKALILIDDRNTTVHTYNENFAQVLYKRLEGHAYLMEKWLGEVESRLE
jgi:nucleotidyltransferase substrate binding protein (TIGR01987 family)